LASEISENVAVGEIIGYGRVFNPFSKKSRVIVKANDRTIRVPVDYRQKKYIQNEHQIGDKVAVGFYGGEWHIGSPPAVFDDYGPGQDISELDLLQHEMDSLDLLELIGRPFNATGEVPTQDSTASEGEEIGELRQKAVMNLLLSEIDEHRDYIRQVEQDIRKSGDVSPEGMGQLSDSEAVPAMPSQVDIQEYAGDGEDIEALRQKAVINLLLSEIDDHRDYLKEIEQDIKKNSDSILEDLGLSHLKKENRAKKLKQTMAREEIRLSDKITLAHIKRLDLIIIQNNEIISKLEEIIYLLNGSIVR
jgi:hypothetical protein